MQIAVDNHEEDEARNEKGQKKATEVKEKQRNVKEVNEARQTWFENRLVGFNEKDKAQYSVAIQKLSKKIETAQPSRERLEAMNDEVRQMVKKERRRVMRKLNETRWHSSSDYCKTIQRK